MRRRYVISGMTVKQAHACARATWSTNAKPAFGEPPGSLLVFAVEVGVGEGYLTADVIIDAVDFANPPETTADWSLWLHDVTITPHE